ncbi:MAG TPA: protein kinase [Sandaracinaceae bacterium LLY-WYZ-13_1]|nr:protein kinase [Sandaracinaceae bacterium LLY-WYZ-13_1]
MAECPTCGRDAGERPYCPHDGTPLSHVGRGPAAMPEVGDVVDGRYRLLEELGRGGMAIVYLAQLDALDREVALKVLFPRWAEDRKQVTRFAREARAASQIDHDAVVKVYDFGYAPQGFYFLAMERLEGEPLELLLRRETRLRPGRAMGLLRQIAAGIARAHALGVIHRDLKPENVMVRRDGGRERVTLVDFGLSKIQQGEAAVTGEGDVIGTPDFMAPEQWQGRPVDTRADVYSFGVMAYEMLSGELPFGGETLIQKLQQHLYAMPLELSDHPRSGALPPGLSDLVMRCMAKDPLDRPPHMGRVHEALRAIDDAGRELSAEPTRLGVGPAPMATVLAPAQGAGLDRLVVLNEIRRLTRVRQRRLADLIPRASVTAEIAELQGRIAGAERALAEAEEAMALAEASLQEAQRAHRAKEAELRAQLVEANLALAVARDALPGEVTDPRVSDTIAMDAPDAVDAQAGDETSRARETVRRAEARLAAFVQREDPAVVDAESELDRALSAMTDAESPLEALYAALERAVRAAPGTDLSELAPLDSALETYRVRLDLLERRAARADS